MLSFARGLYPRMFSFSTCCLLAFACASISQAQTTEADPKAKPSVRRTTKPNIPTALALFFPIEKNNIKILPQRFEYELINKDQFRIGNIVFDARLFDFRVSKGEADDKFNIKLRWPAGLLSEGEISIRDNIGKAIWIHPIEKEAVKFKRTVIDKKRMVNALLEGEILPESVFRSLQFVPYFQVCIQKTELPTRISLCSKDFFVQATKGRLEIRSRDSLRQESFVNINGTKVDNQGVIFLQSLSDVISMRVLLLSGSTIDVDTRMKEVEFRDISANQGKTRLLISGFGAEPSRSHKTIGLADGSWRTEISLARPVIYLRGEGDIPMRQEFILEGPVRDQTTKIETVGNLPISTYASKVEIEIRKSKNLKLRSGDSLSEITEHEGTITWTLKELSDGARNRRFLTVNNQEGQKYIAAWDVVRHPRWDLTAQLGLPFLAHFNLRGWMENQRLGFGLDYEQFITEWKRDIGPTSRLRLPIYISLLKHYNFQDSTYGLLMTPTSYTGKGFSTMGVSFGGFAQLKMNTWKYLGNWSTHELTFFHTGLGGETKLSSEIHLRSEFLYDDGNRRFKTLGLELTQATVTKDSTSEKLSQLAIFAGYKWLF